MSKPKSGAAGSQRRATEVKSLTSNSRLVSEIDRWRRKHENTPSSIDVLLAHPFMALEMSLRVGVTLGWIRPAAANVIRSSMRWWDANHQNEPEVRAINAICGAALNARKRGLLKSIPRQPKGAKQA
jgi:hypothetical protein